MHKTSEKGIYSVLAALSLIAIFTRQVENSCPYSIYKLCESLYKYNKTYSLSNDELSALKKTFRKDEIEDSIKKPETLGQRPNIILIFTEGLSQHIIDDSRNIMPKARAFQKESITFRNYYNHAFATFMGLQGQLYSGYQQKLSDTNSLVSIQGILKKHGYKTNYLLTEPKSDIMINYVNNFDFDEVITSETLRGHINSISDKDVYEMLFDRAQTLSESGTPFFLATYTLGTHCSLDSINEKYSDGKNFVLNRFYDSDYQFGKFFEKFRNSGLCENTILIYTTDHATYEDSDYTGAFPNYRRSKPWLDKIPLSIFYRDVESKEIDANGRNFLGLAPTILDLMDISEENYFLGTSLFSDAPTAFDYTFESLCNVCSTKDSKAKNANDRKTESSITDYFNA